MTMTVLERILGETRAEVQWRKRKLPLEQLRERVETDGARERGSARPAGAFQQALAEPGIAVIAEFKRRSPSAGSLHEAPDIATIVSAYEHGGASALSVLTEGPNFGGSLDDLRIAQAASTLPILRKDFIVEPYQLYEARLAGADAVLLIVAAVQTDVLAELHTLALQLGLDVLVEVHDESELAVAAEMGARVIGVNNRDLRDFSVDVERTFRLLEGMPAQALVVSESGIGSAEQLQRLQNEGVAAVLVGESLMRASDPAQALTDLFNF